jgi:hypothetical protein
MSSNSSTSSSSSSGNNNNSSQTTNSFCDVLAWLGAATARGGLRSEPRLSVRAPVRLVAPIDPNERAVELFDAETRDITPGGMCLVAAWRPTPGQVCKVELPAVAGPLDNESGVKRSLTSLRCRVCYTVPDGEGAFRTGLTFLAAA